MTLTTDTAETTTTADAAIVDAPTLLDGQTAAPADVADSAVDPATLIDKAGEGDKAAAEKPAVPEAYEIKLEDGQQIDTEALQMVEPILKELGLDNDQANKLASAWPGLQAKMAERFAAGAEEAQIAELNRLSTQWEGESVSDSEIGGAPEVMGPKMAMAAKARDQFASPELRKLLTATRLGNHPEVIRLFYKVGQTISEGAFVRGDAAAPRAKEAWEKIYPDMKSQT